MAGSKTCQFTGKVLEIKDNVIIVEKGKEKFEMTKDANTKIKGDLKVSAKVTVQYESRAAEIEVKAKQLAAANASANSDGPRTPRGRYLLCEGLAGDGRDHRGTSGLAFTIHSLNG